MAVVQVVDHVGLDLVVHPDATDNQNCTKSNSDVVATIPTAQKLSHKEWKKQRRKLHRQQAARDRDETIIQEDELKANSPRFQVSKQQQETLENNRVIQEEIERQRAYHTWLQLEENSNKEHELKLERERARIEQEKRIREEWVKMKTAQEETEKRKQEALTVGEKPVQPTSHYNTSIDDEQNKTWHKPLAPHHPAKRQEDCTFYLKTGTCRYGDMCSRHHPAPVVSTVLMVRAMFGCMSLDKIIQKRDDIDQDASLEYDDDDTYEEFVQFYNDTLPEFKSVGKVIQFKVCCNMSRHLKGNVYVQYEDDEHATKAYDMFNGRWYAGKQLHCSYAPVSSWKRAICGLYQYNRCPKRDQCNFLHVFKNPDRQFQDADHDNFKHKPANWTGEPPSVRYGSYRGGNLSSRHDASPRYTRSERSHRWSPSSSKSSSRRRSRDEEERNHRRSRQSRSRSRSPSRRASLHSSKSSSKRKKRDRSESRSSGDSRARSRSRSRSMSKNRSKKRHKKHKKHKKHRRNNKETSTPPTNQNEDDAVPIEDL